MAATDPIKGAGCPLCDDGWARYVFSDTEPMHDLPEPAGMFKCFANENPEPKKIVIDLAGALEKITPEMIDQTKDLMIEGLIASASKMREALEKIIEEGLEHPDMPSIALVRMAREGLPQ